MTLAKDAKVGGTVAFASTRYRILAVQFVVDDRYVVITYEGKWSPHPMSQVYPAYTELNDYQPPVRAIAWVPFTSPSMGQLQLSRTHDGEVMLRAENVGRSVKVSDLMSALRKLGLLGEER